MIFYIGLGLGLWIGVSIGVVLMGVLGLNDDSQAHRTE
jgi:hypothetical protein